MSFIKNLQGKSKEARERIAYLSAGSITLVVLIFWAISFASSNPLSVRQDSNTEVAVSPVKDLLAGVQGSVNNLSDSLSGLSDSEKATAEAQRERESGVARLEVVDTDGNASAATSTGGTDTRTVITF